MAQIVVQHDGRVNGVARAHAGPVAEEIPGPVDVGESDGKDVMAELDEEVVDGSRQVQAVEPGVPVENFLQDLGARERLDLAGSNHHE